MQVVPGETALAFYRAKNPTDKPIIGISTYNVVPFEAGQYFNKIQVRVFVFVWSLLTSSSSLPKTFLKIKMQLQTSFISVSYTFNDL